jgi:hypothetical protein
MNTKAKPSRLPNTAGDGPRHRTLAVKFAVTDHALEDKVKKVFDMARSAGRDLHVTFCQGAP